MKRETFISVILLTLVVGCGPEVDTDQSTDFELAEDFYRGDASSFSSRMHYINRTLQLRPASSSSTSGRALATSSNQLDYYWQHIASVDAPVISDEQLSATHFDVKEGIAYVSSVSYTHLWE